MSRRNVAEDSRSSESARKTGATSNDGGGASGGGAAGGGAAGGGAAGGGAAGGGAAGGGAGFGAGLFEEPSAAGERTKSESATPKKSAGSRGRSRSSDASGDKTKPRRRGGRGRRKPTEEAASEAPPAEADEAPTKPRAKTRRRGKAPADSSSETGGTAIGSTDGGIESTDAGDLEDGAKTRTVKSRGIGRTPVARRPSRRRAVQAADEPADEAADEAIEVEAVEIGAVDVEADEPKRKAPSRRRGGSRRGGAKREDSDELESPRDNADAAASTDDRESSDDAESDASDVETATKPRRSRGRRGGRGRGGRRRADAGGAERTPEDDRDDVADDDDDSERSERSERSDTTSRAPRQKKTRGSSRRSESDPRPTSDPDAKVSGPKPQRRILVNATDDQEIRIAVVEDGRLDDLHYERPAEKKYLGNVYKGRIVNLEPAIQAAFVDLGIGRNGFLHVSDVLPAYKDSSVIPVDDLSKRPADRTRLRIQDILRKGQELLVQISKDSIGMKGPSLTTYVSVPGRYLVLMPGVSRYGVSKRIQDYDERAALRKRLAKLEPPAGIGYIVRTAGEDMPDDVLEKDFNYLMGIWDEITEKVKTERTPCLIFQEHDLVTRALRDLFGSDIEEIFIDEAEVYERARAFLLDVVPQAAKHLKHYTGSTPLFSKFGVEQQIERIYNRRVPLPSGGWIVIEQTEALVAIDVNSGKYRDAEDLESTALLTNLEAAEVIARELRLRDLGGVIINDFIDMEILANRRQLESRLKACLKGDKAKSWTTRVSRFGIIEMTRQRVRPSFESSQHDRCSVCTGSGWVKAPRATGISILRRLRGEIGAKRKRTCEVTASPGAIEYLANERRRQLCELEDTHNKQIVLRADTGLAADEYHVKYR